MTVPDNSQDEHPTTLDQASVGNSEVDLVDLDGLKKLFPAGRIAAAMAPLPAPLPDDESKVVVIDAWPLLGHYRLTLRSCRNPRPAIHVWYWRIASCEHVPHAQEIPTPRLGS